MIEAEAVRLIEGDFQVPVLLAFIKRACGWGGYSGIAGRVRGSTPRRRW
ncbi:hypothetical protein ACFQY5_36160 [Paeniroseomonas aquatica]|uniref:Uncharacterized protein n=1 Tax=Paeniroseomonas aquatica TaxID=373043 RepID=A0ABT8AGE3_9PROT|nr:hypothetical protein [Paeniroseomonas aquatica]MDN3568750.1 hypothetical protein [Paeniroseomonas aquatica]